MAPSSASSKNASRATGSARSTADRVNRHRGVWSARSCVFSASNSGRSASIHGKSAGRFSRYGRVSKPAARFSTRSQPSAIASAMASSMILVRAMSHQPLRLVTGVLGDDRAALLARETLGQWVAEQRVGPR